MELRIQNYESKIQLHWWFWFLLSLVYCLLASTAVSAAEIYFGGPGATVGKGDIFEIGIFLNTDSERINAMEGEIVYDSDVFSVIDVRDGNSIIPFWIERPQVVSDGVLSFAGMIPGGYAGSRGRIFSLLVEAKTSGLTRIASREEWVLRHDAEASSASVRRSPLQLDIADAPVLGSYAPPDDEEPPESFIPGVAQNDELFQGEWFSVFATQDKGLGVDHYEAFESRKRGIPKDASWVRVESPYRFSDQSRRSYVYIKAVDEAGNERISVIPPLYEPWYTRVERREGIIIGLLVPLIVLLYYFRQRKH